jgi:hypothetical protein
MSLINDALKRAKQTEKSTPPPLSGQPLQPVEAAPRGGMNWFLLLVAAALLAGAGLFIGMALARRAPAHPSASAGASEVRTPTPTPPPPEVSNENETPAAAPTVASTSTQTSAHMAVATNIAPPPPRLQGIVYAARPWAIVSGKTVYVGDYVGDMRVDGISQNSVTLVGDGETNRLLLGE